MAQEQKELSEELKNKLQQIVQTALADEAERAEMSKDPLAFLKKKGIDTTDMKATVIPQESAEGELSEKELATVSGGAIHAICIEIGALFFGCTNNGGYGG
ncbi:bacteriocin [Magnetococcales bacterium HHB-1]